MKKIIEFFIILKARFILKKKHKTKSIKNIRYIGFTDCSMLIPGAKLYQFNIIEEGRIPTTIAYAYKMKRSSK